MKSSDIKDTAKNLIKFVFGQLIKRANQVIKNFNRIDFYEVQRDWEFADSYDFWRSFEGPRHWSSARIHEIREKKKGEESPPDKITLHMNFSNFVPTLPGWNAYKEFNLPYIMESVGKKTTVYEGINTKSLIPAMGYSMIRPPVLLERKWLSKKAYLYLSAFRRIVPDGILVYLGSEVVNYGEFKKVINILNEYGSVEMRLKGIPEQVKTLSTPSDKFFKPFVDKLKAESIGIPNIAWSRIRVESPDDIYWDSVSKSGKLDGAGSIWNAIKLGDELCFFQKSIHLGVDYYKYMLTQAAEDIQWEISKYRCSPLFSIDAYSNTFDNAEVIPWKSNEVYDQDFMIKKESFSKEEVSEMDSEFLIAHHKSYIKGFQKTVQLHINEASELIKKKEYEIAKYQISYAESLLHITLERIENEKLMFNEAKWFKEREIELHDLKSEVEA